MSYCYVCGKDHEPQCPSFVTATTAAWPPSDATAEKILAAMDKFAAIPRPPEIVSVGGETYLVDLQKMRQLFEPAVMMQSTVEPPKRGEFDGLLARLDLSWPKFNPGILIATVDSGPSDRERRELRKMRKSIDKTLRALKRLQPPRLRRLKNADNDYYRRYRQRLNKRQAKKRRRQEGRRKQ